MTLALAPSPVRAAAEALLHEGAMVALVPSKADTARLAVDGGEAAEELHVTLVYLGKAETFSPEARQAIVDAVRAVADDVPASAGKGFALSVFNPGTEKACIVLGVSGEDLEFTHDVVAQAVDEVEGVPEQHSPWIPHITLAYTGDVDLVDELTDRVGPVKFDRLRVAFAGEATDIDLTEDDEDEATPASAVAMVLEARKADRGPVGPGLRAIAGRSPAVRNLLIVREASNWNPALHPRGRRGRFRTTLSKLINALNQWTAAGGDPTKPRSQWTSDPFQYFTREQLRRTATKDRELTLPRGASRDAIADALIADLTGQQQTGTPNPNAPSPSTPAKKAVPAKKAAPSAAAGPPGSTKVSSRVAGIQGVTQLKVPVQPVSGPLWMQPTETLEIHFGGQKIGEIHRYSYGWAAVSATGNPVGQRSNTKTAAVTAIVNRHQQQTLMQTGVSGATLLPWSGAGSAFSSAPGAVSLDVEHNGIDIGAIHTSGPPLTATQWTAFVPHGAGYTFPSGNPGENFPTKDAAVQGLVDAHNLHMLGQAVGGSSTAPSSSAPAAPTFTFTTRRLAGTDIMVMANGADIGAVLQGQLGDWYAHPTNQTGLPNPLPGTFTTRAQAKRALQQAYIAAQTPAAPSAAGVNFSTRPLSGATAGPRGRSDVDVLANGALIGAVYKDTASGRWNATAGRAANLPTGAGPVTGGPFRTRKDAVDALQRAYVAANPPIPPPAPAAPVRVDPAIVSAQEVLYGVDPKAKTATRQLQVYGALRRTQFDSLDSREKTTMLADLSYIATTSKGPNAAKAQRIIDRFTPPGTPSGTTPSQPIIPPPSAVASQTRVADPAGTPGLLKVLPAGQRGQSGDGWTRSSSGGSGPWGQYGAAGLMLRHVDDQGVERFLMIERGPGISDPGKWQFPGGAKEEKEDFYQGAAREVIEELGFGATDLDTTRVHGTYTFEVPTVMVRGLHGGQVPWAYVTIAATVPKQLKPDLSTHHARMETSDAKWMTRAEIEDLDKKGKLLRPLAGGQVQSNVMTLFPGGAAAVARPGPVATRPRRLTGTPSVPKQLKPHKTSRATDLVSAQATRDKLRQDVKQARTRYTGKAADDRLAAIGEIQGYDETPTVVTKAEMDRLLATGDYIEAWRGQRGAGSGALRPGRGGTVSRSKTAAQIQEEFRSGPAYYGSGMYGFGFYFATDKSVARGYSDGTPGSLLRVLIPKKEAKIERHDKVEREAHQIASPRSRARGRTHEVGTLYDAGRYAAAKGLDAVEIPHNWQNAHVAPSAGRPAYLILNRSVMIVQEA